MFSKKDKEEKEIKVEPLALLTAKELNRIISDYDKNKKYGNWADAACIKELKNIAHAVSNLVFLEAGLDKASEEIIAIKDVKQRKEGKSLTLRILEEAKQKSIEHLILININDAKKLTTDKEKFELIKKAKDLLSQHPDKKRRSEIAMLYHQELAIGYTSADMFSNPNGIAKSKEFSELVQMDEKNFLTILEGVMPSKDSSYSSDMSDFIYRYKNLINENNFEKIIEILKKKTYYKLQVETVRNFIKSIAFREMINENNLTNIFEKLSDMRYSLGSSGSRSYAYDLCDSMLNHFVKNANYKQFIDMFDTKLGYVESDDCQSLFRTLELRKGFRLYLRSIEKDKKVDDQDFWYARNFDNPILIKRDNQFSIYGYQNNNWQEMKLDLAKLSHDELRILNNLDFKQSVIESDELNDSLLETLIGHTPQKERLSREAYNNCFAAIWYKSFGDVFHHKGPGLDELLIMLRDPDLGPLIKEKLLINLKDIDKNSRTIRRILDPQTHFSNMTSEEHAAYGQKIFDLYIMLKPNLPSDFTLVATEEKRINMEDLKKTSLSNTLNPILVNQNGKLKLYVPDEKEGMITELPDKLLAKIKFPVAGKASSLPASSVPIELYKTIQEKNIDLRTYKESVQDQGKDVVCDILLVTLPENEKINTDKMAEVSKSNNGLPILIQHGSHYYMYGNTNETQWKLTELLDESNKGCDVYLMSPVKPEQYKKSDKNHLYLYKNDEHKICYRMDNKIIMLEDEKSQIPKHINTTKLEFDQPEHNPKKYDNYLYYISAILDITSNRGDTLNLYRSPIESTAFKKDETIIRKYRPGELYSLIRDKKAHKASWQNYLKKTAIAHLEKGDDQSKILAEKIRTDRVDAVSPKSTSTSNESKTTITSSTSLSNQRETLDSIVYDTGSKLYEMFTNEIIKKLSSPTFDKENESDERKEFHSNLVREIQLIIDEIRMDISTLDQTTKDLIALQKRINSSLVDLNKLVPNNEIFKKIWTTSTNNWPPYLKSIINGLQEMNTFLVKQLKTINDLPSTAQHPDAFFSSSSTTTITTQKQPEKQEVKRFNKS